MSQRIGTKKTSFECLRSVNNQLHNKLAQENEYDSYLKRISSIVDRRSHRDTSSQFYMSFIRKCKEKSRLHRDVEENSKILCENQHLLNKITVAKAKKGEALSQSYHLAMYQKRNREIEKINQQNSRIAKRITQQYSVLRKSSTSTKHLGKPNSGSTSNEKKSIYAHWNYSPIKERKLPKLIRPLGSTESRVNESSISSQKE